MTVWSALWLSACLSLCLAQLPVWAGTAGDHLPLTVGEVPVSGLRASSLGKPHKLRLLPIHPAAEALYQSVEAEQPNVVVETLFIWEKPAAAEASDELLVIYNIFRAIGSLEGIEYWSASRKSMRPFYVVSHQIGGPEGKMPIADVRLQKLPTAPETLYARQKDLSFGDNRYRIVLHAGDQHVSAASANLTRMFYGVFPVADSGEIQTRTLAINANDAILLYIVVSAEVPAIPGLRSKLEASFGNRAASMYGWFAKQAVENWPRPKSFSDP